MRDFDYEVKQRKNLARNARYKKNGSKSKYVSLPSDNLTAAEKRKLNGEVIVYKIGEPISWSDFKSYPQDVQVKYLEYLRDNFGASNGWFKILMGIGDGTMYPYLKDHNLKGILSKYPEVSKREAFLAWCNRAGGSPVEEKKPVEKKSTPAVVTPPAMFYNVISSCEMNLSGKASEISQMLFNIFQNQNITVSVKLDSVKEEPAPVEGEVDTDDCVS